MSHHSHIPIIGRLSLLSLLLIGTACGGSQSTSEDSEGVLAHPPRARYHNIDRSGYSVRTSDINLDGRADQFHYTDSEGRLVWEERDLDWDGDLDFYAYYDAQGQVVEREYQLDFDDAIDVIAYYQGGQLVRKELTSGFSEYIGIVKYYGAGESLLRVEHDLDQDGHVDLWEYYEDGHVVRTGRDLDGDGMPDQMQSEE